MALFNRGVSHSAGLYFVAIVFAMFMSSPQPISERHKY